MNDNLTQRIAKFIKDKRIALGLNQGEFAQIVLGDVKYRSWINKIEHGRPITVTTLGKILDKLNSNIDIVEF